MSDTNQNPKPKPIIVETQKGKGLNLDESIQGISRLSPMNSKPETPSKPDIPTSTSSQPTSGSDK